MSKWSLAVDMTRWRMVRASTMLKRKNAVAMAEDIPMYLPITNSGRPTGLLTTVSTVLFSISLEKTPVAVKAASSRLTRKMVLRPMSISSLLSSSMV